MKLIVMLIYVLDLFNNYSFWAKAFQKAWKIACSLSSEAKIVVPAGKKFLVRPIDFSGPCRSGLTLWVRAGYNFFIEVIKKRIAGFNMLSGS